MVVVIDRWSLAQVWLYLKFVRTTSLCSPFRSFSLATTTTATPFASISRWKLILQTKNNFLFLLRLFASGTYWCSVWIQSGKEESLDVDVRNAQKVQDRKSVTFDKAELREYRVILSKGRTNREQPGLISPTSLVAIQIVFLYKIDNINWIRQNCVKAKKM